MKNDKILKVGITGQSGFIGTYLYNTLGLYPDKYQHIHFEDDYFSDKKKLNQFVSGCDVIVHLAAVNRHNDPNYIYEINVSLVRKLTEACQSEQVKPHILFSSSTQEERDNLYGASKKAGREIFEKWAEDSGAMFTGFVIPNVFGPFGNPYYNSVVATFCHQLTHNEIPKIEIDSEVKLIYIAELTEFIVRRIDLTRETESEKNVKISIPYTRSIKVSELLNKLNTIKDMYFSQGIIPDLSQPFDRNLFNTFLTYIDHRSFFPFTLNVNSDERGSFVEILKLNGGGQVSFSTTKPGITRGNHFHTRKAERFAVLNGSALIEIRRIGTDEKLTFKLDGKKPSFVDMPVWYTHNITNIGDENLVTLFWINEHYNQADPDTFFVQV